MSDSMETEIRALEKRIWELAGCEFNVNSPQQLAEILFDKLNLATTGRRSRAKARSTAADVLSELALLHELPRKVIEYRELTKLKSTYVDALPKLIEPATGRLHTRLSQTVAATGRLSSSDPNLQNIPVRSELGREIRAAFVADPGWTLLSADYSQIELRILAHFSEDPVLIEAFRTGQDIHARTAQEVFGVGPMAQTPEHRRVAKVINFGIIYGLSPFGLAQQLGIEQREAAKFIAAYFQRYRGVKEYLDRSLDQARREGFTRTLFGRRRPIPEIVSPASQPAQSRRTHRAQYAAARHRRRPHQARHDPHPARAGGAILPRPHDPASPRRAPLRSAARGTRSPPRPGSPGHGAGSQTTRSPGRRNEGRPELARHALAIGSSA